MVSTQSGFQFNVFNSKWLVCAKVTQWSQSADFLNGYRFHSIYSNSIYTHPQSWNLEAKADGWSADARAKKNSKMRQDVWGFYIVRKIKNWISKRSSSQNTLTSFVAFNLLMPWVQIENFLLFIMKDLYGSDRSAVRISRPNLMLNRFAQFYETFKTASTWLGKKLSSGLSSKQLRCGSQCTNPWGDLAS